MAMAGVDSSSLQARLTAQVVGRQLAAAWCSVFIHQMNWVNLTNLRRLPRQH